MPAGGALVLALGTASSTSASASSDRDPTLDVRGAREACARVTGAGGSDVVCASAGTTVLGFRDHPRGAACPAGGRAVSWGTDANGSGVLDPSELEGSTYVCRSSARGGGTRAVVATTTLAPRNGHCPLGGTLVQSGIDRDDDGTLAPNEVDRATFSCNRFGGPALAAFVDVQDEPAGGACRAGGKRIAVGHDGESARISYACDAR